MASAASRVRDTPAAKIASPRPSVCLAAYRLDERVAGLREDAPRDSETPMTMTLNLERTQPAWMARVSASKAASHIVAHCHDAEPAARSPQSRFGLPLS